MEKNLISVGMIDHLRATKRMHKEHCGVDVFKIPEFQNIS